MSNSRPPRLVSTLDRALCCLRPDGALLVLFLGALAALVACYSTSFVRTAGPFRVAGGVMLVLLAVHFTVRIPRLMRGEMGGAAEARRGAGHILRDWGPFVLLLWAFSSLESYTGVVRHDPIDDTLYRIDVRLFGVEPTAWVGRFAHPVLTDVMSIAYGSYFLMPLVLAVAVHLRGRRDDFVQMSSGIVLQMGLAFLLFLVFPAGPPRYYGPLVHGGFEPAQLHSWLGTYELQQRAFDAADPVRTRSAFPSLHCSLALFTLFAAFRHGDAVFPRWPRLYFWACAPVVVMLWLSTIYLRHHWIPDCAAGILLALLADVAARWLHDRWRIAARRSADASAGVASWPPVVEERNDPVSARGRA